MKFFFALSVAFLTLCSGKSVNAMPHPVIKTTGPLPTTWNANWIAAPGDDGRQYGVYYFRKQLQLAARPAHFMIHVSADNRYKLFVNDSLVSLGPARGDLY